MPLFFTHRKTPVDAFVQCSYTVSMTYTIAFAGKGGVGKTTTCGMFIDYLARQGHSPILAVDADANSNLNEVLGVDVDVTLGDIREEMANANADDSKIPASMTKQEYASFKFADALIEQKDFDLLVMGRTQSKGCYCFVNDILREQIRKYYLNYKYLVVDNEAGLEHISRGILPPVDLILLVSDCSRRGIQAVGRIAVMIDQLELKAKDVYLIVNRAPNGVLNEGTKEEIEKQNLKLLGVLPQDNMVFEYDSAGKPLITLPESSPIKVALNEVFKKLSFA
ncbi:MAG: carbon monoxide dehydrogenase accessory protein CooC [Termitinemataceae bacterium]|nr:MAG: carbon monoxide dehydrogenase accessory protein CooC [Termitinemataceae bacterium]